MSTKTSKEYKAINNYIHNELGITIEQLIEIMVDNKLSNNRGYYCMYSCCCNIDREDNTNVIYKEVKRS